MLGRYFVLILFLGSSQQLFSQSEFWKNVKIRKAFETETSDDDKAANLSFAFPKSKTDYFLINAGIGYNFYSSTKLSKRKSVFKNSFSGFFVYNRNNQIDEEQDNYKLGISSSQVFLKNVESMSAIFGLNTLEYLRDKYDSSHSVLFTSYWHPFSKLQNGLNIGGYAQNEHIFAYFLSPQIGIEYQNKFQAKQADIEGNVFRGFFGLGGNLLLKKKTYGEDGKLLARNRWKKGVELLVRYDGRVTIFSNIDNIDSYVPIFKAEMNVYPTRDNMFSIGLSYSNGANPIDGLAKQTFWLLAFKFKK
jgi:hypothetical protein